MGGERGKRQPQNESGSLRSPLAEMAGVDDICDGRIHREWILEKERDVDGLGFTDTTYVDAQQAVGAGVQAQPFPRPNEPLQFVLIRRRRRARRSDEYLGGVPPFCLRRFVSGTTLVFLVEAHVCFLPHARVERK